MIARWKLDNRDALRVAHPALPNGIHDLVADTWTPMVAIADRADRKWPKLVREAALALFTRRVAPSKAKRLPAHMREAFGNEEALFSADLVQCLVAMPDAMDQRGIERMGACAEGGTFRHTTQRDAMGRWQPAGVSADAWKRWQIGSD